MKIYYKTQTSTVYFYNSIASHPTSHLTQMIKLTHVYFSNVRPNSDSTGLHL